MSTIEVFVRLGLFVIGLCAIAFVALSVVFGFPKPAEATYQEHKVTICHKGQTIEVSAIAARHHLRQHEEDYRGECKQEEPKDYCDTLEGVQDEETYCPPVEEEEPPVIVPETPKVDTPDAPKVRYSQGPNGVKGDGKCQTEWRTIKGSKKVEIRYAEDGIFGNGYKTLTTEDDGAEWLNADSGKMKLRGRDSKTDWSKAKSFSC